METAVSALGAVAVPGGLCSAPGSRGRGLPHEYWRARGPRRAGRLASSTSSLLVAVAVSLIEIESLCLHAYEIGGEHPSDQSYRRGKEEKEASELSTPSGSATELCCLSCCLSLY